MQNFFSKSMLWDIAADVQDPLTISKIFNDAFSYLKTHIWSIAFVIVLLIVGYFLTKLIVRGIEKVLKHSSIDVSLHHFIRVLVKALLYAIILLTAASALGIDITTFIAALSIVGLAISLAVQDSLKNVAGGALILVSKPFVVGDFVEVEGVCGTVQDIGMLYTRINTPDNKRIFVPNGQVSTTKIINYSSEPLRRLDLIFSISYEDSFETAQKLILDIIERNELALKDPAPLVRMNEHSDSAIDIAVKVWVNGTNYWQLHFDMHEQVKKAFDENGITIPFSQMEITLKNQ